jgi:hypothetical protein
MYFLFKFEHSVTFIHEFYVTKNCSSLLAMKLLVVSFCCKFRVVNAETSIGCARISAVGLLSKIILQWKSYLLESLDYIYMTYIKLW